MAVGGAESVCTGVWHRKVWAGVSATAVLLGGLMLATPRHDATAASSDPCETIEPTGVTTTSTTVAPSDTTIPDTTIPDTTIPDTTIPDTTIPDTTIPDTTIPDDEDHDETVAEASADPSNDTATQTATTLPPIVDPPCGPSVTIESAPGYHPEAVEGQSEAPAAVADITPEFPQSASVYEVRARVTTAGGLSISDLESVRMCWYLLESGTSNCGTRDPRYEFEMTWIGGTFAVSTSSEFPANGYSSEASSTSSPSPAEVELVFRFKVSGAMTYSNKWSLSITARYSEAVSPSRLSGTASVGNVSVGFVAEIASRERIAFGPLADGQTKEMVGEVGYLANGPVDLILAATDFVLFDGGSEELDLLGLVAETVTVRTVRLSCVVGASPQFVLGDAEQTVSAGLGATGETPTAVAIDCALTYGGGALRSLVDYSSTIFVRTIAATPGD